MEKLKNELGKWFMDISKYILTAFLLTTLFSELKEWSAVVYIITTVAVIVFLVVGLFLINNKKRKE